MTDERSYRRRLLDRELAVLVPRMRGRILEIGAGRTRRRGRFRPPIDGVSRWITLDRRAGMDADVNADALGLPFGPATFDAIVCLEVLEYVADPPAVLAEMRRVLRANGLLVMSVPFMHRWDDENDRWRFSASSLRSLLDEAGLTLEEISAQGAALSVVANILTYVIRELDLPRPIRAAIQLAAAPVLGSLVRLDAPLARSRPRLATFATGYLIVARAT